MWSHRPSALEWLGFIFLVIITHNKGYFWICYLALSSNSILSSNPPPSSNRWRMSFFPDPIPEVPYLVHVVIKMQQWCGGVVERGNECIFFYSLGDFETSRLHKSCSNISKGVWTTRSSNIWDVREPREERQSASELWGWRVCDYDERER